MLMWQVAHSHTFPFTLVCSYLVLLAQAQALGVLVQGLTVVDDADVAAQVSEIPHCIQM